MPNGEKKPSWYDYNVLPWGIPWGPLRNLTWSPQKQPQSPFTWPGSTAQSPYGWPQLTATQYLGAFDLFTEDKLAELVNQGKLTPDQAQEQWDTIKAQVRQQIITEGVHEGLPYYGEVASKFVVPMREQAEPAYREQSRIDAALAEIQNQNIEAERRNQRVAPEALGSYQRASAYGEATRQAELARMRANQLNTKYYPVENAPVPTATQYTQAPLWEANIQGRPGARYSPIKESWGTVNYNVPPDLAADYEKAMGTKWQGLPGDIQDIQSRLLALQKFRFKEAMEIPSLSDRIQKLAEEWEKTGGSQAEYAGPTGAVNPEEAKELWAGAMLQKAPEYEKARRGWEAEQYYAFPDIYPQYLKYLQSETGWPTPYKTFSQWRTETPWVVAEERRRKEAEKEEYTQKAARASWSKAPSWMPARQRV